MSPSIIVTSLFFIATFLIEISKPDCFQTREPTALTSELFQDSLAFIEANGLVVIEAESVDVLPAEWSRDSTIAGYTGNSSLRYIGNDLFNTVGRSLLSYKIFIHKTGRYRFRWRSRIAIGTSNSEHNDSWLRMPDASDFYAQDGQTILYPKGSGRTPNPNGSGADGWFKAYQNNNGIWSLQTWTSDNDRHPIFVEFDTTGLYTIEIAGRSNGHSIDRIMLYHVADANETLALEPSTPESPKLLVQTSLSPDQPGAIRIEQIQAFPNPVSQNLTLETPTDLQAGVHKVRLFNNAGQEIKSMLRSMVPGGTLSISAAGLNAGLYLIQFSDGERLFQSRFVRD